METFLVPVTFPSADSAERDATVLADAVRVSGVAVDLAPDAPPQSSDRPDAGPATRELRLHAASAEHAANIVAAVAEGQFPAGLLVVGEPVPVPEQG